MVDQEPLRSIQVVRRLDSRVPVPLLSSSVASTPPNLGKSGPSAGSSSAWSKPASPAPLPPMAGSGARGWGPIVNPRSNIAASSATSGTAGSGAPSRAITPDVGVGPRKPAVIKMPEENVDVPDNWEDDV